MLDSIIAVAEGSVWGCGRRAVAAGLAALVAAVGLAASDAGALGFNFEIREPTGANSFAGHTYLCTTCTLEQFEAVVVPAGYDKRNPRYFLPSSATQEPLTPPPGVAASLDFVAEIPGDDFFYVAEILNGSFLGFDAGLGAVLALAQVQRSNVFTYDAGEVVHEVVDGIGNHYVLFLFDVYLAESYDLGQVGSLASFGLPAGWTYESRVLASPLVIDTGGVADVFSHTSLGAGVLAAWQLYEVPEAGAPLAIAAALGGLALLGWRARDSRG
jgi:hypothetical protein